MSADISIANLFLNATLFVKLIMFALLIMSILSWAIILKKFLILKEIRNREAQFKLRFSSDKDIFDLYQNTKNKDNIFGSELVFKEGFYEYHYLNSKTKAPKSIVISSVRKVLDYTINKIALKLEESIATLATIASVSPYVGLLGTVWGIMHSFIAIGSVQQATLAMVAPGIAEALIATAMGLLVAIPASIAFNRFSNEINNDLSQIENFSEKFLGLLQHEVYQENKDSEALSLYSEA